MMRSDGLKSTTRISGAQPRGCRWRRGSVSPGSATPVIDGAGQSEIASNHGLHVGGVHGLTAAAETAVTRDRKQRFSRSNKNEHEMEESICEFG